jgi:Fe-S-cluster-containing dehydrogenase component
LVWASPQYQRLVGGCEICQDACPWNRKHLNHPLSSKLTESFQKNIGYWEDIFYLPELAIFQKANMERYLGGLIPAFHMKFSIGMY